MGGCVQVRLDRRSGVPYYRQIIEQVEYAVATGRLGPGDQLPTLHLEPDSGQRRDRQLTAGTLDPDSGVADVHHDPVGDRNGLVADA